MASSIDLGAIVLGAALGYGLKNEIRDAGSIARNALLGAVAAAAATSMAQQAKAAEAETQQAANAAASQGQNQAAGQAANAAAGQKIV